MFWCTPSLKVSTQHPKGSGAREQILAQPNSMCDGLEWDEGIRTQMFITRGIENTMNGVDISTVVLTMTFE